MSWARKSSANSGEIIAGAAVVLLPIAFTYFRLDLRSFDLPPVYGGDAAWMFLSMKNMLTYGWSTANPTLGFPIGSDAVLEPIYPTDAVLLGRILSFFITDPTIASNVFVYLTHIVNAAIAFACFRVLRLSAVMSLVGAMSFAFLEFATNPGRVYAHQTLTLFGALAVAGALSLLPFRYADPWSWRLIIASILGAVLIGLSHPYYVAFSAMVILLSAVMLVGVKRTRGAAFGLAILLVIAAVMTVSWFGPTALADIDVPYAAPNRFWNEQSWLGLRVPDLLLPPRSSNAWLQSARDTYHAIKGGTFDTYLGLVGVFGATIAVLLTLRIPLLRARSAEESQTIGAALVLALFCLVFGMTNGLGLLFSMTVTAMLRAQDRIIPLLAFYCIYVGLCTIENWRSGISNRTIRMGLASLVFIVVALGLFDQTYGLSYAALQATTAPVYRSDRQFYAQMEQVLSPKTAVLQLPPMFLPEDSSFMQLGLGPYDQLKGSTYTNSLRWSFGLSSENEGYLSQLDKDPRQTVSQAMARGFGALLIYKDGYSDHGAALMHDISALLNVKPVLETAKYTLFLLPAHPVPRSGDGQVVAFWRGLSYGVERTGGRKFRLDNSPDGTVTIFVSNHKDHPAKVWLSLFLVPSVDGEYPGTFSVDGNFEGFVAARPGIDLSREIALSPGRHRIAIHLEVPRYKPPLAPAPGLHFRLREPTLTDVAEIEATAAAAKALSTLIEGVKSRGTDNPAALDGAH